MTTLAQKKRRERTNTNRKTASQTFIGPGGIYHPTFGKKVVYLSGHGQPGNAPQNSNIANYNPPTPAQAEGYTAYNPPTPGMIVTMYYLPSPYWQGLQPTPYTMYGYYSDTPRTFQDPNDPGQTIAWTDVAYSGFVPGNAYYVAGSYNPDIPGNVVGTNPPTPGNYVSTNPATPSTIAYYNPSSGGTLAGYNPLTPGYTASNPPVPGQIVYTQTWGPGAPAPNTYISSYFTISPGSAYNETNDWYSTYNVQRPADYYVPGNNYYVPSSGGNAVYNPVIPGNAVYNPEIPGNANYNPPVPGNTNYNPPIPGNANYSPPIPGNANYNNPTTGQAGVPVTVLGVTFPGGALGSPAMVVGRSMVFVPYSANGIALNLPPGAEVTIEET